MRMHPGEVCLQSLQDNAQSADLRDRWLIIEFFPGGFSFVAVQTGDIVNIGYVLANGSLSESEKREKQLGQSGGSLLLLSSQSIPNNLQCFPTPSGQQTKSMTILPSRLWLWNQSKSEQYRVNNECQMIHFQPVRYVSHLVISQSAQFMTWINPTMPTSTPNFQLAASETPLLGLLGSGPGRNSSPLLTLFFRSRSPMELQA